MVRMYLVSFSFVIIPLVKSVKPRHRGKLREVNNLVEITYNISLFSIVNNRIP